MLFGTTVARADADDKQAKVLPPDHPAYGKTYGEWSAAWWEWVFSLETIHHPLFDTADASAGQKGEVWFLGGTLEGSGTVVRNATIPEGTALFFPIIDNWADNTGCPVTTLTTAQLRALAKGNQDLAANMTCTIDGVPVPGLSNPTKTPYRVQSPVFGYTLPPVHNILYDLFGATCYTDAANEPISVTGAVADGVFILLSPLPVGHHTIHFTGALGNPAFFTQDITYHITVAEEDLGNPEVFEPDSRPYGKTYGEWSAKNWEWVYSLPASHHPLFDTAPISTGQSGPVWFLGGTYTTTTVGGTVVTGTAVRSGTVPEGKALFFPIVDAESATAEGNGSTEAQLRASSVGLVDHTTSLSCEVDGHPLQNLALYRAQSPLFTWGPLPADSVFQDPINFHAGLKSPSVSDGYFVMLAPFKHGHHTIHFTGSLVFTTAQDGFDFSFSQDITYHLTVVEDGR